ncbi:FusB/FusC family EF-G-binding protein [Radiobacillus kanasensis]|uniref:FusB/FusC family EF-G-binding protein n=1 Tax=Radiobacillus kanasensis TaxID=2844358 RepID=UPI001E427C62|nr:FusB/FusC family EF-G-binding protein [Radiobacillus kanasensis]UFT99642.1 FusB/FusC family EF-G-binding protein [Radiobacillus kanasensis]
MEAFIQNHQFNYIKQQVQSVVHGHSTANDKGVLAAVKSMALERSTQLFNDINDEQRQLLEPIGSIVHKEEGDQFLSTLKPYVIPFQKVSAQTLKKLFPKVKKLKTPSLDDVDWKSISYLGWNDSGSEKKFLVVDDLEKGKLVGLQGTYKPLPNQKGICVICNHFEEVGLFVAHVKGSAQGMFTRKGNYICQNTEACNERITSLDKLHDFVNRVQQKE